MAIRRVSKNRTLYVSSVERLSYRKGMLFYETTDGKVQNCRIGGVINRFALLERLTRREPRCAAKVREGCFVVSFHGVVLEYQTDSNEVRVEHVFDRGMNNPLEFLTVFDEVARENQIFYGEYIWNAVNGPVAIYKRTGDSWSMVFEFPSKTITHIHNIVEDAFRDGFIILTGDEDSGSGIWLADRDFKDVKPLLLGSQQYRSCVAFPEEGGILFATDTPLEPNYIYFAETDTKGKVISVVREYELPGPCIYGTRHRGSAYFATSVEPDSGLPLWRFRFTYKLGRGVKNRYTHIIRRMENGSYQEVCAIKKDVLPMWLFQFGNALFPKNENAPLEIVLQGTNKGHGVTYSIEEA